MTFKIAAWGFHGPANLSIEAAACSPELRAADIHILRAQLGEPLPPADVVWVQGATDPNAVPDILSQVGGRSLFVVPPVAQALQQRESHPRVAAALRRATPARLVHAALLCAHLAGKSEDPGECPDDSPHGWWPVPKPENPIGTAVLVASVLHVAAGDEAYISEIAEALVAENVTPLVWLGPVVDDQEKLLSEKPDVWLNLTGFTLTGNHGAPKIDEGTALATASNAQILTPVPLQRGNLADWEAQPGPAGLWASAVSMNIAIPELEGATVPWVFAGRNAESGLLECVPGNVQRLAKRIRRTIELRNKPVSEQKISVTIFGHDSDGTIGTAAHLDVFESLLSFLGELKSAGYTVEVPNSKDELIDAIVGNSAGGKRSATSEVGRLSAPEYARLLGSHVNRIDRPWGRMPGEVDTDGRDLIIRGARFGNILVGVQPQFGDVSDPAELLRRDDATPSHSFASYYLWLENRFRHDAMLHFGTHGALEFMPGRQTGLALDDWPLLLTGDVPHSYLYIMANPGEGTIAKRRSAAGLISYLTPPLSDAGLYEAMSELSDALDNNVSDSHLEQLATAANFTTTDRSELRRELERVRRSPIAMGLHVVGQAMSEKQTERTLELAQTYGTDKDTLDVLKAKLQDNREIPALVNALQGGYTAPVAGGDPARRPDALPTGRNVHGVDPATVPTPRAWERGKATAEELIRAHREETGSFPSSIAMVLWGIDNIKTSGEGIAQAFALIGAEPITNPRGRVDSYRIQSLTELGRPRVDVVCTLSGVCRDVMPNPIALLDDAIRHIAQLDEPSELNPIAANTREHADELDMDIAQAAVRIFSAPRGGYGTGVNKLVQAASWDDDSELAEMYLHRMGHAWGKNASGDKVHAVLQKSLGKVDATFQNVDSAETSLAGVDHYFEFLGGASKTIEHFKGSAPASYVSHSWQAETNVETLASAMRLESRTRLLNPKWIDAQLSHGYAGVAQVKTRLENTFGMQATTNTVEGWVFTEAAERLLLDDTRRQQMERENPAAVSSMTGRLLEAHDRGLWEADEETIQQLEDLADHLDAVMEGI